MYWPGALIAAAVAFARAGIALPLDFLLGPKDVYEYKYSTTPPEWVEVPPIPQDVWDGLDKSGKS